MTTITSPKGMTVSADKVATPNALMLGILQHGQNVIGLIVSFFSILGAGGLVTLNSFIASYQPLHSYQFLAGQYFAAGVWIVVLFVGFVFVVALIGVMVSTIVEKLSKHRFRNITTLRIGYFLLLLGVPAGLLAYIRGVELRTTIIVAGSALLAFTLMFSIDMVRFFLRTPAFKAAGELGNRIFDITVVVVIGMVFIILLGNSFGGILYPVIPRIWGGGQPYTVQLSSANPDLLEAMDIPLESNGRTAPVCFLAELTNGILVYSPELDRLIELQGELALMNVAPAQNLDCLPPLPSFLGNQ